MTFHLYHWQLQGSSTRHATYTGAAREAQQASTPTSVAELHWPDWQGGTYVRERLEVPRAGGQTLEGACLAARTLWDEACWRDARPVVHFYLQQHGTLTLLANVTDRRQLS